MRRKYPATKSAKKSGYKMREKSGGSKLKTAAETAAETAKKTQGK